MRERSSVTNSLLNMAVCRRLAIVGAAVGLCLPLASFAQNARRHHQAQAPIQQEERQTAPAPPPPTLEHTPSRLPTVTFQNGALTIVAYNATLRDILEMVRSETGAVIDIPPDANERVFVRLGPGPVRRVLDSLLVGSAFNYVMLGSAADPDALTMVILTAKPSEVPEKGSVQRAAHVLPNRRESAKEQSQAVAKDPIERVESSAPPTEAVASTVTKQEDTAKQDSASKTETHDTTENAAERGNSSVEGSPRTPNIRTAQEVLQDLYARRRQAMEQQNQQQPPR